MDCRVTITFQWQKFAQWRGKGSGRGKLWAKVGGLSGGAQRAKMCFPVCQFVNSNVLTSSATSSVPAVMTQLLVQP